MNKECYCKLLYMQLKYDGYIKETYRELMEVTNLQDRFTRKFLDSIYKPTIPPFDDCVYDSFLYAICINVREEDIAKELFLFGRLVADNGMFLQVGAPMSHSRWKQLRSCAMSYAHTCMRTPMSFVEYLYSKEVWYFAISKQCDCYERLTNTLIMPDVIKCSYVLYAHSKYKYFPFMSTLHDLVLVPHMAVSLEDLHEYFFNPECVLPFESYTYGIAKLIASTKEDRYLPPKLWSKLKFDKYYGSVVAAAEEFAESVDFDN